MDAGNILTQENASKSIKDFQMLIDLADCEKDSAIYYDASNVNDFIDDIVILNDVDMLDYFGGYEFKEVLSILLFENTAGRIDAINTSCTYSIYQKSNNELTKDPPSTFIKAAQKQISTLNNKHLVINFLSSFFMPNPIPIIVNDDNGLVEIVNIPWVQNFLEIDNWLQNNRLKRQFNDTDMRHIEGNPSHIKGKSPLLGGIGGRPNAANLLISAIGDKNRNKGLMNFDTTNNAYIWFEYENDNPQNKYHAYHLVKPNSHENDIQAESKLPQRVIEILKYRQGLSK